MNEMTDVVFTNNVYRNMEGNTCAGIYGSNWTRVTLERSVFHNLSAGRGAALMIEYATASVVVENNLFYGNRAVGGEAAGAFQMYNFFQGTGSNDRIQNNTFVNNAADGSGNDNNDRIIGMSLSRKEMLNPLRVRNNLFSGANRQVKDDGMERDGVKEYYAVFENNALPVRLVNTPEHGLLVTTDPKFVNPSSPLGPDGFYMTEDDGYRLQSTSPCINKGLATGASVSDLAGLARNQGGAVDIGCYESGSGQVGVASRHSFGTQKGLTKRTGLQVGTKGVYVVSQRGVRGTTITGLDGAVRKTGLLHGVR